MAKKCPSKEGQVGSSLVVAIVRIPEFKGVVHMVHLPGFKSNRYLIPLY